MMRRIRLQTVLVLIAFIALILTIVVQQELLRRKDVEFQTALGYATASHKQVFVPREQTIAEREEAAARLIRFRKLVENYERARQAAASEESPPGDDIY
jgi:hypothetical protein